MSQKRNIFEDVTGAAKDTPRDTPKGGMIDRGRGGARRGIRAWLILLFALVAVMVIVGGLTRLTDSGLSITEWKPITGALPPMDQAAWDLEFEKYQEIPEFKQQNEWMTLEDFKQIYWWEWGHRQLGRVIGLVWALGFLGFLAARKIPAGWTGRLLLVGALGGAQGAIGWWMVHSGLSGEALDVASYRLATHLGLAFVIFGFLAWYIFSLERPERDLMQARRGKEVKPFKLSTGLMHFAFLQILLGALVAGIDAGRSYPDWPLMNGAIFPAGMWDILPWWRNLFENPGTVQFIHRIAAYLLVIFGVIAWNRGRRSANRATRAAFHAVLIGLIAQAALGVATVMHLAAWQVAIVHLFMAMVLWVLILRARFLSLYPLPQSVRG